jgi:hypothetical protein
VIIDLIREIATHLITHHMPKLKTWKETLQQGILILNERSKRKNHIDLDLKIEEQQEKEKQEKEDLEINIRRYQEKLDELNRLFLELKNCLTGKCKDLLKK